MPEQIYGSLINTLMAGAGAQPVPVVGMGATMLHWSDRHAGTIVRATKTRLVVRRDRAIRTDARGMTDAQAYRYEPNPDGEETVYCRSKAGVWRIKGGTTGIVLGVRQEYHDYGF